MMPKWHVLWLIIHWRSFLLWFSLISEWDDAHINIFLIYRLIKLKFFYDLGYMLSANLLLTSRISSSWIFWRKVGEVFFSVWFLFFLFAVLSMNVRVKDFHLWWTYELLESNKSISLFTKYSPFFWLIDQISCDSPGYNWT